MLIDYHNLRLVSATALLPSWECSTEKREIKTRASLYKIYRMLKSHRISATFCSQFFGVKSFDVL